MLDSFGSRGTLQVGDQKYEICGLAALEKLSGVNLSKLPFCLKILLENLVRNEDGRFVKATDIEKMARWSPTNKEQNEIAFMPARVLLQDFTGVPAVADLAAMRDAIAAM